MLETVVAGNASEAGQDFNGWFIGAIERWSAGQGRPAAPGSFGLRQSDRLEVKWGVHPRGQLRPGGWTTPTERTVLAILLRGDFLLTFCDPQDPQTQIARRMQREGDYVVWCEQVPHTWQALEDSVVLTVRWLP